MQKVLKIIVIIDLQRPPFSRQKKSAKSRAWRACVLTCLACLRDYALACLACLRTWRVCVLVLMKCFIFLRVCVLSVLFCLICFTFQYLNLKILTAKNLCALLS